MTSNVSQKDIYEAIQDFRKEVTHMFDKQSKRFDDRYDKVQEQVDKNTNWKNKAIGQATVIFTIIGIGVNWIWEAFSSK